MGRGLATDSRCVRITTLSAHTAAASTVSRPASDLCEARPIPLVSAPVWGRTSLTLPPYPLRIVCWNVRGPTAGNAAWDYLLHSAPDVALLQEVRSIPDSVRTGFACRMVAATGRKGTAQKFSTAILV